MAYLLDTNVFIQAKNLYYGLDFCPAFWEWLIQNNEAERVFSIEMVGDELEDGSDELAVWAAKRGSGFFLKPDPALLPALGRISSWAAGQRYEQAAVNMFLQEADYYLIAYALAHEHTVVTHEIPSTSTKKIKIPDACIALNIKFMTPFMMLKHEKARFVLKKVN